MLKLVSKLSVLFHKIKQEFFQAVAVLVLLYSCTTWTLKKHLEKYHLKDLLLVMTNWDRWWEIVKKIHTVSATLWWKLTVQKYNANYYYRKKNLMSWVQVRDKFYISFCPNSLGKDFFLLLQLWVKMKTDLVH